MAAACGVGLIVGAPASAITPDPASAESARRGAAYLATTQGGDGSTPDGWPANAVAETVVALVAGGAPAGAIADAVDFLADEALDEVNGVSNSKKGPYTGRIVSGLVAAGENPRAFAGTDFVALLLSFFNPVTGGFGGDNIYADGLAMLGVLAAGEPLPDAAVTRLTLNQCDDGGWSYHVGCTGPSDTDTTVLAMSVLAAKIGPGASEVGDAREWLLDTQNATGGWGFQDANPDSANSTGLALSGIAALGEHPGASPWTAGDRNPLEALRSLQLDSGAFQKEAPEPGSEPEPNNYATVQAVPGVAGWAYPVSPPPPGPSPSVPSTRSGSGPGSRSPPTEAGNSAIGRTNGEDGGTVGPGSAGERGGPLGLGDERGSGRTQVMGVSLRALDALMDEQGGQGTHGARVAINPTSTSTSGSSASAWVAGATLAWVAVATGWTWRRLAVGRRNP